MVTPISIHSGTLERSFSGTTYIRSTNCGTGPSGEKYNDMCTLEAVWDKYTHLLKSGATKLLRTCRHVFIHTCRRWYPLMQESPSYNNKVSRENKSLDLSRRVSYVYHMSPIHCQ